MHDNERKIDPRLGRSHGGRRCPRISPYVVVRFTAEFLRRTGIPYDDEVPGEHLGGELWQAISGGDPRVRLRSVYPAVNSRSFKAYDAFVARQSKEPLPNLRGFYRITGPRETDFARILSVLLAAKGVAEPRALISSGRRCRRRSIRPASRWWRSSAISSCRSVRRSAVSTRGRCGRSPAATAPACASWTSSGAGTSHTPTCRRCARPRCRCR